MLRKLQLETQNLQFKGKITIQSKHGQYDNFKMQILVIIHATLHSVFWHQVFFSSFVSCFKVSIIEL